MSAKDTSRTGTRLVILQSRGSYVQLRRYLVEEQGFADLCAPLDIANFLSRTRQFARLLFVFLVFIPWHLRTLREAEVIVCAGGHTAIPVKALGKLGLLRYRRLYWYPFFVHKTQWFPLFRLLAYLDTPKNRYVVNTQDEIDSYAAGMGIDRSRMVLLPYVDWNEADDWMEQVGGDDFGSEPYYFAGGYSNRDYLALIEAFRQGPWPLLIVCSRHNRELDGVDLPSNIEIRRDIPLEEFEACVRRSKACILPLTEHASGGKGVLFRYMKYRKAVIANKLGEYLESWENGVIVEDIAKDLPGVLAELEKKPELFKTLGTAAFDKYCRDYSPQAAKRQITELVTTES